jgi:hypothetical protein
MYVEYPTEYTFDYLMITAQAYQESTWTTAREVLRELSESCR